MTLEEDEEKGEQSSLDLEDGRQSRATMLDNRSAQRPTQCGPVWKRPLCKWGTAAIVALTIIVVTVAVCRTTVPVHENPCCPNKWTRYEKTCYFVSKKGAVWKSAQENCKEEGGSLLVLDNTSEPHIAELFTLKGDYWIGLRKVNNKWTWTDGSVYTGTVNYDGPQVDCAYLNSDLGALGCSSQRPWICKKSL